MRTGLAALLVIVLGACAYQEPKVVENVVPAEYRTKLLDILRERHDDPTGIRDAFIAAPTLKPYGGVQRYIVCLRYNAKNKSGQYEGSKDFAAFYYAGEFTQLVSATRELCGDAAYQPYPELQKLCRSLDCKS